MSLVRPTEVLLLDFFCSGIQLYVLLSPYLCFFSFLYLDWYVLGDYCMDELGTFHANQTSSVLIHIRYKVEVLPLNIF